MFTIDTNQTIRISRGDDSGDFTLMVNEGTTIKPIRHEFAYGVDLLYKPAQLLVSIDETQWALIETGIYTFTYYTDGWYNDKSVLVDLSSIGITVVGTPAAMDVIKVRQVKYNEEIQLYVYKVNDVREHALIKKVFAASGDITTTGCMQPRTLHVTDLISEDGDMKLFIEAEDTAHLPAGTYTYVIIAKLFDIGKNKYYINTITNEHKFYILNTGYGVN